MAITATQFFATDPALLTADVEDRFFTELKTRNNTFKRTASDRFARIDEMCVGRFEAAGQRLREVLDIGVSSGATTLALHANLKAAGQSPAMIGTDISLGGYLVPVASWLRVLVDEQGHPLQFELFGRAIRAWRRRADWLTGMAAVLALLDMATRRAVRRRLAEHPRTLRAVRLLSPRLRQHPEIAIEKNDIFCQTPGFVGRFDFIRAANILNRGYFDEAMLRAGLDNILHYLSGPGAWLLVARSSGAKTDATLFQVSPDGRRLQIRERIGMGSEVERLVMANPLPLRWVA